MVGFVIGLVQAAGFEAIAGHTAAERAAFGRQMLILGQQFSVLVPPPIHPETMGGYLTWRVSGSVALLFAGWALASAAGAGRGDEERGLVDDLIAAGLSRTRLIAARIAAFAIGCFVAALAVGAGELAGSARTPDFIGYGGPVLAALPLTVLALSAYVLTLLVCQLTADQRSATAVAGVLLLALYLLDTLSRAYDSLHAWRGLSPFYYYGLSQPLAPGGKLNTGSVFALVGATLLLAAAAAIAFNARDLGSPIIRVPVRTAVPTRDPSRLWVWQTPIVRGLYEQRIAVLLWTAGLSALAVIFVNLTKTLIGTLLAIPGLAPYFAFIGRTNITQSFLGFEWSGVAELLIAAFAITQVARWAADDANGRLEEVLSHPFPRSGVILERLLVLTVQTVVIAGVSALTLWIAANRQGIGVETARVEQSALLLVPLAWTFGGVGAVMTSLAPRPAVAVLSAVAIGSYFIAQLGPLFKWPQWALDMSLFQLYGNPLASGVDRNGLLILLAVTFVTGAAAIVLMRGRDIGR